MRPLYLGVKRPLDGSGKSEPMHVPPHHLVTHGAVVGMTGSGKTGLLMVMVEEALRASVPVLVIDVKGDLPNLLLSFASFDPGVLAPWVEPSPASAESAGDVAARLADERRRGLAAFSLGEADLADFTRRAAVRVITPGADAGELLHVLSALERRSARWDTDLDGARAALSAAISLILRLLGRDPDPARSREHVLLALLAERRLRAGEPADIGALLPEIVDPPLDSIGALSTDAFLSKHARKDLAASLNSLLASPSFASWRQGATLDVAAWMKPVEGRTPATVISVAHLDDDERALVLGVLLEEILSWVRALPGSQHLKALIVFDETYGFLPPHPASPPTKRPLVALMKQARAFGVGVVIATQNPMDLDYRALGNAGFWALGRLQTDADRERVIEGLANEARAGESAEQLADILKQLAPRWFTSCQSASRPAHSVDLRGLRPLTWTPSTTVRRPGCPQPERQRVGAAALDHVLHARAHDQAGDQARAGRHRPHNPYPIGDPMTYLAVSAEELRLARELVDIAVEPMMMEALPPDFLADVRRELLRELIWTARGREQLGKVLGSWS